MGSRCLISAGVRGLAFRAAQNYPVNRPEHPDIHPEGKPSLRTRHSNTRFRPIDTLNRLGFRGGSADWNSGGLACRPVPIADAPRIRPGGRVASDMPSAFLVTPVPTTRPGAASWPATSFPGPALYLIGRFRPLRPAPRHAGSMTGARAPTRAASGPRPGGR